ncbi:fimbrial protein [Burkholderia ubonensis]|uniref:fimbrial protein n=1 Tax=Burkholderia ubonensis TaxID=101571 RepID=UPI00075AF46C|nr:fimbrial protein [Burkholderia ubonensis]KVD59345.1 hypothetical protein WI86_33235 [Burkholderia ubonensis]
MTITISEIVRNYVARRLSAIALMVAAVAVTASPAKAETRINAFAQQISIPKNLASGTILARYSLTPWQVCGQEICRLLGVVNYANGNSKVKGPTVTTNVSGVLARMLLDGQAYETNEAYGKTGRTTGAGGISFAQSLEVQLLADGRPITGGTLGGSWDTYFYLPFAGLGNSRPAARFILAGTITAIDGTCSVPAQTVKLPNAQLSKFGDVGSTLGTQSFQIRVDNCPKGYNRVGYALDPRGGVIANAPGVLPLTDGSTASGVKIRLADDKGVPAVFGTSIKIDAYNKATGGSYAIPMQASYIKTDATVKPGTVNGAMTVLLDYQ